MAPLLERNTVGMAVPRSFSQPAAERPAISGSGAPVSAGAGHYGREPSFSARPTNISCQYIKFPANYV